MKWRTDKPTADNIVAKVEGKYLTLYKFEDEYYVDDYALNESYLIPYDVIEKWVDLEEDDNGICITYKDISNLEEIMNYVHYEFRNGISKDNFGKEVIEQFKNSYLEENETVTDCHKLEEEISRYMQHFSVDQNLCVLNKDGSDITPADIDATARHFTKWGAEHLNK